MAAWLAGPLSVLLVLTGCSKSPVDTSPPTIEPAQAAVSPPALTAPAGVVRPLRGAAVAAVFDARSSQLAVLANQATQSMLTLFGGPRVAPRVVELPGPAAALSGDNRGTAFLATRGGYFTVDLVSGSAARVQVDGEQGTEFTAIGRRADGTLVLGSADGSVFTLASATSVGLREKIFAHVDSIVTQGNTAVVLDRGQTSITALDAEGRAAQALRAGEGATTMTADPAGRVLVADTRGEELLVFGVDPLILRQRYPIRSSPYGLAGGKQLAWVSETAANSVVGYDLATGIPIEKVRYPTVQQPNSLAYDDATGTLYVVSGSGAGVQAIDHAAQPR